MFFKKCYVVKIEVHDVVDRTYKDFTLFVAENLECTIDYVKAHTNDDEVIGSNGVWISPRFHTGLFGDEGRYIIEENALLSEY